MLDEGAKLLIEDLEKMDNKESVELKQYTNMFQI